MNHETLPSPPSQAEIELLLPASRPENRSQRRYIALATTLAVLLVSTLYFTFLGTRTKTSADSMGTFPQIKQLLPPQHCGAPQQGVNYEYQWGLQMPHVVNLEGCCQKCGSVPACVSWTWVSVGAPECWLKSGAKGKTVQKAGFFSGVVPGRPSKPGIPAAYAMNYQALHLGTAGFQCASAPLPNLWSSNVAGSAAQMKLLDYNLMWWNVFDQGKPGEYHHYKTTSGNGAISLIKQTGLTAPNDIMSFQECQDLSWVLGKAALLDQYRVFQGKGVCMAYRLHSWSLLDSGDATVGEDKQGVYWGKRFVQWMRLRHKASGTVVFFMNHHGPLPVDTGGACGMQTTAANLLNTMSTNAQTGDVLIVTGDFNANAASVTLQLIGQRLNNIVRNEYDNIFSNLDPALVLHKEILGTGGSDHHAITATLQL